MADVLIWKDAEVKTIGELVDALYALESPREAQEFMRAYAAVNEHAYPNVGYCSGYMDHEDAGRVREWCQAAHPIFGMKSPTPEAAFKAGQEWARG